MVVQSNQQKVFFGTETRGTRGANRNLKKDSETVRGGTLTPDNEKNG